MSGGSYQRVKVLTAMGSQIQESVCEEAAIELADLIRSVAVSYKLGPRQMAIVGAMAVMMVWDEEDPEIRGWMAKALS